MILNQKDLLSCRFVCTSWNKILDDPKFWMKICSEKTFGQPIIEEEWKSLLSLSISANVLQPNIKLCLIKLYGSDDGCFIRSQCSKNGKKVQFQKYKNTLFAFKNGKKSIFAPEKSPKIVFLVVLNFFLVQKLIFCHF